MLYQKYVWRSLFKTDLAIFRNEKSVGLRYDGKALQSIHTHWKTEEKQTQNFNEWFKNLLTKFKNHPPIKLFQATIIS
jgi:beta-lactamase class D